MESTVLNQRYRLMESVGAGGMATVYRGEDLLLERTVAIKFLREPYASDPSFRERFIEEARAAARLDHPNIVHIYDVGEDEENASARPFIVMEMVEGEDLKALIHREGPFTVHRALDLARQICAGVGNAHRAGIVHCDLKPQNMLVTPEQQIKVADFGIARALQKEALDLEEDTEEKVVWGSPHYISPEQATGKRPTPASDVYSIGVILYEMLTGVPPFHDNDPEALVLKQIRDEPPALMSLNPRVPPGLEWLVRKVLSKEPAKRYRNADQLGMALEEYMRQGVETTMPHVTPSATPPPPTHTPPPPTVDAMQDTQPVPLPEEIEWQLWALVIVAAIAVLGLIPLWLTVWNEYTQTGPGPLTETTVTPTVPPEGEMVTTPNLLGLNASDAQRLAESLGLSIDVIGEQESTDARPGAVLDQTPNPGTRVLSGSTVNILLAAGRAITLPDVIGYQIDIVQEGLESEGLLVEVEELWSTEPKGTILDQAPEAENEIRAGATITLTVSGGINMPMPMQVNLNDQVMLEDARVVQLRYHPGDSVPVTLRWRSLEPLQRSMKVFVHLLTPDMQTLIAQRDVAPMNGLRPTDTWVPGEIINDPHQVIIPDDTPAGTYQIRVGLYDAQGRLPVVDPGETEVFADTIFITNVEIQP